MKFMETHGRNSPYGFTLVKCDGIGCDICKPIRCPESLKQLVMQQQPTPLLDKMRKGHFQERNEALSQVESGARDKVDLSDLPLVQKGDESGMKARKERDAQVAKEALGGKSFDASMVRGIVKCFECNKPRCVFSKTHEDFDGVEDQVQRQLEQARFVCGSELFALDRDGTIANSVVIRSGIECSSQVERAYFDPRSGKRFFKAVPVCIHCGESEDCVLIQNDLEKKSLTEGRQVHPICNFCLEAGKKVVALQGSKKRKSQETTEYQATNAATDG